MGRPHDMMCKHATGEARVAPTGMGHQEEGIGQGFTFIVNAIDPMTYAHFILRNLLQNMYRLGKDNSNCVWDKMPS